MSNPPALPPDPETEPAPTTPPPSATISTNVEPRGLQLTSDDLKVRESQTARHITITLLLMLGVTFVINYVVMILLTMKNRLDAAPLFERMFSVWMPLLSGLVGSAVTFYLSKERK